MNTPYIVNFFTQRDYERIPTIIKAGANEKVSDPKTYDSQKR